MILLVISDLMRDDGGAGVGVQGGHQLPQHQGHESGKNCTNYNQSGGQNFTWDFEQYKALRACHYYTVAIRNK